jgi:rhodanese-related sulfurtransferase
MNNLFNDCRLRINGIIFVLPSEVLPLIEKGAVLVDMREEVETDIKSFAVDSLVCLPHDQFDEKWESLPLGKPLILADSVGIWSKTYAATLLSKGFSDVASLAGGFNEWLRDGYPVTSGNCRPMNGPCLCMIKPHEKK